MNQFKDLSKAPPDNVSIGLHEDQLHIWECLFMGPNNSLYEGGFYKALLEFPPDFPNNPPTMKFVTPILHPNVYPDGKVCISILHPPGEDKFNEQGKFLQGVLCFAKRCPAPLARMKRVAMLRKN